jgi:polysaccharide biosynthesis transport protein
MCGSAIFCESLIMSQYYGEVPSFSILDVLRGMGRRKLLMLSSLIIGALLGTAVITVVKPKYQAEARVLIDNFETPYDSANVTQQQSRQEAPIDARRINSQVAALQSQDLGDRVIKVLSLGDKAEFDPMKEGLGFVKQALIATGFSDDPRKMTIEQRAYETYSDSLTVYPIPESNVIAIKYTSESPQVALDVANTAVEGYVASTREFRATDNDRVREWLSTQIEGLRQRVAQSDAAVEKYRAEAGLLKGQSTTLGTQELSELSTQISLAEAASTEAKAKAQEIRELLETQGTVEASSEVLASPIIQRLLEQQAAAEGRVTALSATYLSSHPKIIAAQKDVNDFDRRIRKEALKIVDGLQGQAKIAAARANSLRKSLEGLKDREGNSLQDEVKLKELEREAKANRDQLETMLARFADSNTRQNLELQPGFARVIQKATLPASPYFPKPGPIILLASLAGLFLGAGLAFLLEIMSQAAKMNEAAMGTADASPNRARHPARGIVNHSLEIPELDVAPPKAVKPVAPKPAVAAVNPAVNVMATAAAVSLASIPQARTALEARTLVDALADGGAMHNTLLQLSMHLQAMRSKGSFKACALAGIGSGSEVPALSLALARHLSDSGLKTILVDLDGQRNLLPDLMELPHAPGLTELLGGASDFSKAIQRDRNSELQFVRHGSIDLLNEAQLPSRMESITKTLMGIYDVVLLHTGEATPVMLQLAKGCSTALLHATPGRKKDAVSAMGTLKSKGFENVFLIQVENTQQAAA